MRTLAVLFVLATLAAAAPVVIPTDVELSIAARFAEDDKPIRLRYDPEDNALHALFPNGSIAFIHEGVPYMVLSGADSGVDVATDFDIDNQGIVFMVGQQVNNVTGQVSCVLRTGELNEFSERSVPGGCVRARGMMGKTTWRTILSTVPHAEADGQTRHAQFTALTMGASSTLIYVAYSSKTDMGGANGKGEDMNTATVLAIPSSLSNKVMAADDQTYVYLRGVREMRELAFGPLENGQQTALFGLDAQPAGYEEELNWLVRGMDYGFPYFFGGVENPNLHSDNPMSDYVLPLDNQGPSGMSGIAGQIDRTFVVGSDIRGLCFDQGFMDGEYSHAGFITANEIQNNGQIWQIETFCSGTCNYKDPGQMHADAKPLAAGFEDPIHATVAYQELYILDIVSSTKGVGAIIYRLQFPSRPVMLDIRLIEKGGVSIWTILGLTFLGLIASCIICYCAYRTIRKMRYEGYRVQPAGQDDAFTINDEDNDEQLLYGEDNTKAKKLALTPTSPGLNADDLEDDNRVGAV